VDAFLFIKISNKGWFTPLTSGRLVLLLETCGNESKTFISGAYVIALTNCGHTCNLVLLQRVVN
jgi:hypothetical protein